ARDDYRERRLHHGARASGHGFDHGLRDPGGRHGWERADFRGRLHGGSAPGGNGFSRVSSPPRLPGHDARGDRRARGRQYQRGERPAHAAVGSAEIKRPPTTTVGGLSFFEFPLYFAIAKSGDGTQPSFPVSSETFHQMPSFSPVGYSVIPASRSRT